MLRLNLNIDMLLAAPYLSTVLACALGALADAPRTSAVERRVGSMGTTLALRVEADTRERALEASERAVRAIDGVEARLTTWRDDSELSRLNRAPTGEPIVISRALAEDLEAVRAWWSETGGAFDPSIGALARAWGLRSGGRIPSTEEIRAARVPGGLAALELAGTTVIRRHDALVIDESGFGKGVGLDAALRALETAGAVSAELDFGGQVALLGRQPRTFALADPRDRSTPVLAYVVDHGSIATSGNSEHGFTIAGRRFGHILDPLTGRPAPDFGSMTVWTRDATAADCLSKALFVLGPDRALAWVSEREGIEMIALEIQGERLVARASAGWQGRLRAISDALVLELAAPRSTHIPPQPSRDD